MSTKYPLVFIHGAGGFDRIFNFTYFFNIETFLRKNGYEVYTPRLTAYDRIENSLWGYDEESSRGSLRTYITRLRSLLGKKKIETIKHVGYRYVP